jgi:tRNA pseudouridine55 synthase
MAAKGRSDNELCGLLLADKAQNITSHDVVLKVRRLAGQKTVGHTGTLDPLATGLMCLLLGKATKLEPYLVKQDKLYYGKAHLGLSTDTDDVTGKVLSIFEGQFPGYSEIAQALKSLEGPCQQVPPAFSAIKVNGRTAHKAARNGCPLELPARAVTAFKLKALEWSEPYLSFTAHVSSGYYIRSLVRDLGKVLGLGSGALCALRRLSCGPFKIEDAGPFPTSFEEIAEKLIAPREALHLPELQLDPLEVRRLCLGTFLNPPDNSPEGVYKIIGPDGSLSALAQIVTPTNNGCGDNSQPQRPFLRPLRVFTKV